MRAPIFGVAGMANLEKSDGHGDPHASVPSTWCVAWEIGENVMRCGLCPVGLVSWEAGLLCIVGVYQLATWATMDQRGVLGYFGHPNLTWARLPPHVHRAPYLRPEPIRSRVSFGHGLCRLGSPGQSSSVQIHSTDTLKLH
jgi:hypothetical protein